MKRVAMDQLAEAASRYPYALLLSGDGAPPHVAPVRVTVDGAGIVVADPGKRTIEAVRARPAVAVVWPPPDLDEYTLIVDGTAQVEGAVPGRDLVVIPERAVLHRPVPAPDGVSPCSYDCRRLD